eukprot:1972105-Pleurochrysis_carterae.AAC.1
MRFAFQTELEAAASRTNTQAALLMRNFWATHQRFFKQLCVCYKARATRGNLHGPSTCGRCSGLRMHSSFRRSIGFVSHRTRRTVDAKHQVSLRSACRCQQLLPKRPCGPSQVPVLVEAVRKALANGHCAVIGLQSTGEGSQRFF